MAGSVEHIALETSNDIESWLLVGIYVGFRPESHIQW